MSYAKIVDRNVTRAFNLLRDLAKIAVHFEARDPEFNFETGEAEGDVGSQTAFKAVLLKRESPKAETSSRKVEIMFKKADVGVVRQNDKIMFDGENYTVATIIKGDGFITIVELYKEA
jgi:hypothetical protein